MNAAVEAADIQAISDWLVEQGLRTAAFEPLLAGFCERVTDAGLRLARAHVAMRTLHPTIDSIGFTWTPNAGVGSTHLPYANLQSPAFRNSPFRYLLETDAESLRADLAGPRGPLDFPVFDEFRAAGMTDYYARLVGFAFSGGAPQAGVIFSWTTDRAGGFDAREVAILDRLTPRFALSLKTTLTWQFLTNLLTAYVGPDAGRRILDGQIRRGDLASIHAVILFADLSAFTALSDVMEGAAMLRLLDGYFDCMVPPVVERGGEVLKFMGDGLLATFSTEGGVAAGRCAAALEAACDLQDRIAALNAGRQGRGEPVLAAHAALHIGNVFYGNIGGGGRQDFTVIGPAVNEASRIEELCRRLEQPILVSGAFADAAGDAARRLRSLGFHVLRGVRTPQELFAVDGPDGGP